MRVWEEFGGGWNEMWSPRQVEEKGNRGGFWKREGREEKEEEREIEK